MSHVMPQTSTLFPVELKRNGFQQFNWKLAGYGLLGYLQMVVFIVYFSSQPMPDISVPLIYTPAGFSILKPPSVGIQFPPTDLKPEANTTPSNIADTGTPIPTPVVQSPGGVSGQTGRPIRNRNPRTSLKDMQDLVPNEAGNSWTGLTTSNQSGTGNPSPASSMANGNLADKLDQVTTISRNGTNHSTGIPGQAEGSGDEMGIDRSQAGMIGDSKQAEIDLEQYSLTTSGPGRISIENGTLSGQVEIDPTSFSISDNTSIKGRAEGDILRVVNSNMLVLRAQYQNALKLNPTLEGVLKVHLTIEANGRVSQVEILEDTLQNSRFVSRITNILRTWRFGAMGTGQTTATLTFPFTTR